MAVQPDGKIVAAGWAVVNEQRLDQDFALARYEPSGTLDPSFGTGGVVTTDFAGGDDLIAALVLQPDGRILVAGWAGDLSDGQDVALARYDATGTLDPSFGDGGLVTTDFGGGFDEAYGLSLLPDGRILVVGASEDNQSFNSDFALAHLVSYTGMKSSSVVAGT